jgi:hypothetical protein
MAEATRLAIDGSANTAFFEIYVDAVLQTTYNFASNPTRS